MPGYLLNRTSVALIVASMLVMTSSVRAGSSADEHAIEIREGLVLPRVGQGGRRPVHTDALEALIVRGAFSPPSVGDVVNTPDGEERTWQSVTANDGGTVNHAALRGGYFYASVESPADRVMLLEASGHSTVYVNGLPRAGDPYRTNWLLTPVKLHEGRNDLLFQCSRGSVKARLIEPANDIMFSERDRTTPDLLAGQRIDTHASILVINSTERTLRGLEIEAGVVDGQTTTSPMPVIGPMTYRRVPFRLRGRSIAEPGRVEVRVAIRDPEAEGLLSPTIDSTTLELNVREASENHKRTFISEIDGSVQYFAVVPAAPPADADALEKPGLVLTLHGAGVHASGQANAYRAKDWVHIVAPTNRRHFGFDWEDWGRWDAMEVLDLALAQFETDRSRTYLTGHSMGGHGTWHVGVTFPDRFAAISPSAGWISFWSYVGAARYEDGTPVEQILTRATSASDTLALSRNYMHHGVFITHGDRDNNVPVEQARTMRKHLAEYHGDFAYYEKPGAGHWWGVDFAPMFDFFRHHTIPTRKNHVEFVTASPGVSATCRWVTIEAQQQAYLSSSVDLSFDPASRAFTGTTTNVERVSISLNEVEPGEPVSFEIDDTLIKEPLIPAGTNRVWLQRHENGSWHSTGRPSPDHKGPHRSGAFKDVFRNRMMFVYGTSGTEQENTWAYAKARFDAETFGYRGNGAIDVVADVDFDAAAEPDRNVILYGNADTNRAWNALCSGSPVQVESGQVTVGTRRFEGSELACLLIHPRPGSSVASVGAVAGTGVVGMRVTDRLPYFVSGVAYPDCIVMDADVLNQGTSAVHVAGFFGNDWTIDSGSFAFVD